MGKRLKMWKNQLFSVNPYLNLADRLIRFLFGITLLAVSAVFIWRAGSTALAQGTWVFPAVPEIWVVATGFFLLPTAVMVTAKSVLPKNAKIFG